MPSVCGLILYSAGGGGGRTKKGGQTLITSQSSLLVVCWFLLETSNHFKETKGGKIIHEICMILRATFPAKKHDRLRSSRHLI